MTDLPPTVHALDEAIAKHIDGFRELVEHYVSGWNEEDRSRIREKVLMIDELIAVRRRYNRLFGSTFQQAQVAWEGGGGGFSGGGASGSW